MLSQAQRTAILELSAKGVSKHEIARVLQLVGPTVRKVLRSPTRRCRRSNGRRKRTLPRTDPRVFAPVARGISCESMRS